jgi:hypothetical protein
MTTPVISQDDRESRRRFVRVHRRAICPRDNQAPSAAKTKARHGQRAPLFWRRPTFVNCDRNASAVEALQLSEIGKQPTLLRMPSQGAFA